MDIKDLQFETSKDEKDLTTLKASVSKEAYDKELQKQIEYYKPKLILKVLEWGMLLTI